MKTDNIRNYLFTKIKENILKGNITGISQIPDDNKVSILSALATVYFENGNYEKAKETALKISEINSTYKSDVDNFLKTIEETENKK